LEKDLQVPRPVGRGWKMEREEDAEQLLVHWMEGQPATDVILDLLACNCPNTFSFPRCICVANGLRCTDMCRLTDCENQASTSESVESSDEDVEDLESYFDY